MCRLPARNDAKTGLRLTGFLGAGKSRLVNRLMTQPGFGDTAVIVNEFGEADLDGPLVDRVEDRAVASTTGCPRCTGSGGARVTLLRLMDEAGSSVGPLFWCAAISPH